MTAPKILTGTINGNRVLVEIYDDGHATIATRPNDWATWSPPETLRAVQWAPLSVSEEVLG